MVIETNIAGWTVTKILVDTGSSADILFASTFDSMKLDRKILQPMVIPLYGFGGQKVKAIEKITTSDLRRCDKLPLRASNL